MFDALATLETPTVLGVGLLAAVLLEGATVRKVIAVPNKMVNFVVA